MNISFTIEDEDGVTQKLSWKVSEPGVVPEFDDEDAADLIEWLAHLMSMMTTWGGYADHVRPCVMSNLTRAWAETTEAADGLDLWSEMMTTLDLGALDDFAFAQLLMDRVGHEEDLCEEVKIRAIRAANHMGPDYAQALYRFAVLVTKLA